MTPVDQLVGVSILLPKGSAGVLEAIHTAQADDIPTPVHLVIETPDGFGHYEVNVLITSIHYDEREIWVLGKTTDDKTVQIRMARPHVKPAMIVIG